MHRARAARTRGFGSSTSIARLGFSMFSKPSYFCMWKFVWADKAQFALSAQTNFHIQKCNTFRELENPSRTICSSTIVQYVIECIEALTKFSMKPIPMMAKVGGVLGTLRYPRLIRPYSAHYGHPVAYYRALGARILLSGPLMGCLQLPVFPIYLNL